MGCLRQIARYLNLGRQFDFGGVAARISRAKNRGVAPEDYAPDEWDEYGDITQELYPKYQEALLAYGAVDFDDLILKPLHLFEQSDEVRDRLARSFPLCIGG